MRKLMFGSVPENSFMVYPVTVYKTIWLTNWWWYSNTSTLNITHPLLPTIPLLTGPKLHISENNSLFSDLFTLKFIYILNIDTSNNTFTDLQTNPSLFNLHINILLNSWPRIPVLDFPSSHLLATSLIKSAPLLYVTPPPSTLI